MSARENASQVGRAPTAPTARVERAPEPSGPGFFSDDAVDVAPVAPPASRTSAAPASAAPSSTPSPPPAVATASAPIETPSTPPAEAPIHPKPPPPARASAAGPSPTPVRARCKALCGSLGARLQQHKAACAALLCAALFVVAPAVLAVQCGAYWTGSLPTGEGWGHGAKTMPPPAWSLDAAARANASLVAVDVPIGSLLEVYATSDGPRAPGAPRVLAFRLPRKPAKRGPLTPLQGAAELLLLAVIWNVGVLIVLSGPLFLALACLAVLGRLAPEAEGGAPPTSRELRVLRGAAACLGALGAIVVIPLAAVVLWWTFAAPLQVDGMELRSDGVSLVRSFGPFGQSASHFGAADVISVAPFAASAGLYELALLGSKDLHPLEASLLLKLIKKHERALGADRFADRLAAWKGALAAHMQSGVAALLGE